MFHASMGVKFILPVPMGAVACAFNFRTGAGQWAETGKPVCVLRGGWDSASHSRQIDKH